MSKYLDNMLMFGCEDERTRRLAKRVYRRLPACDRHVIRDLIMGFSDHKQETGALGSAGMVEPDTFVSNPAEAIQDISYFVNLGGVKEIDNDKAAMFIIAHEFAHVVLRHMEISAAVQVLHGLEVYPNNTHDTLKEWHEDTANLKACVWGFREEMDTFFRIYPGSRRPRWNVELEWGVAQ